MEDYIKKFRDISWMQCNGQGIILHLDNADRKEVFFERNKAEIIGRDRTGMTPEEIRENFMHSTVSAAFYPAGQGYPTDTFVLERSELSPYGVQITSTCPIDAKDFAELFSHYKYEGGAWRSESDVSKRQAMPRSSMTLARIEGEILRKMQKQQNDLSIIKSQ